MFGCFVSTSIVQCFVAFDDGHALDEGKVALSPIRKIEQDVYDSQVKSWFMIS